MAKDPAFLFYPGDFNTGTQFFSDEQVGKYMRLLMAQHQHGHLTENQVIIICKSYDKDVMSKFSKDSDGLWFNERLETEVIKRKKFVKSRSDNRVNGLKEKIICSSYDNHMENENINTINNNKIEVEKLIFEDEQFIDGIRKVHNGKDLRQAWAECYQHHSISPNPPQEVWLWKQKFNTWLTISNGKKKESRTNYKVQ